MRRALAAAIGAAVLGAVAPAGAEEGLFVMRVAGGVSSPRPLEPETGGWVVTEADLGLTERVGVIGSCDVAVQGDATVLGVGLGVKALPYEGMWTRIYVFALPELLVAWPDGDAPTRYDLGARGGVAVEYLFMWGFGGVVELAGTVPAGLGESDLGDGASIGVAAGLFMEF
jgi:hypothetical protein